MATRGKKATRKRRATSGRIPVFSDDRIAAMIEQATVDCNDEDEALSGWYNEIEEHLEIPFGTTVLGISVMVESVQQTDSGQLVAFCVHGRHRQRISLSDLPQPIPLLKGWEWIEAYRRWSKDR